jgi:hypothetical protein
MFKKVILLCATASSLFLFGCEMLEDSMQEKKKTRYVLSFHQVIKYPRSKDLEKKVTSFDGKEYWINTNQFFHSRHIEKIELIPSKEKEGYYDLSLKLDYSGTVKWVQLSMHFQHKKLALLVDGYFYKLYTPDRLAHEDDKWVVLTGPFDRVTAGGVKKYARKNYIHFNPKKATFVEIFEGM